MRKQGQEVLSVSVRELSEGFEALGMDSFVEYFGGLIAPEDGSVDAPVIEMHPEGERKIIVSGGSIYVQGDGPVVCRILLPAIEQKLDVNIEG